MRIAGASPALFGYRRAMLAIALMLAASAPQWEDALGTGNAILTTCTEADETSRALCSAWVEGLTAGIEATQSLADRCVVRFPEGATLAQYRDVVPADLKAHPQFRHLPSRALATMALRAAFPCPARPSKR
jgi:hypothetical protein